MESMTRGPVSMSKPDHDYPSGKIEVYDTTIGWRSTNEQLRKMYGADSMPQTAENVAREYDITREEQDLFAFESQQRAKQAINDGTLTNEIVHVVYHDRKGHEITVMKDEHTR